MLYLDKQVRANALCTSQTKKIELTEQTMVGVLSNEGINARKKEGNPQPYLASMDSVHQDNCTFEDIWTGEARTDHASMLNHHKRNLVSVADPKLFIPDPDTTFQTGSMLLFFCKFGI